MFDWIEKVYYPYIKKDPLCEKVLLIIHKSTSQISEDVIEKNKSNIMDISILSEGTTSIMHPLDISINKKFKSFIKEKYIHFIEKN